MTQEELREGLLNALEKECADTPHSDTWHKEDLQNLSQVINQHVAEVIGEDEPPYSTHAKLVAAWRNKLRAEQRKRAGLRDQSL